MAGGMLISRLYDFLDGMVVYEYHLDSEFDRIHLWLNGMLGDVNISADADIQGTKLKVGSIPIDRLAAQVLLLSDLTAHADSGDHDERYYTKQELLGGQLDERYFTEVELLGGSLDGRYDTKDQVNQKISAATLGSFAGAIISDRPAPSPGGVTPTYVIRRGGVSIARLVFNEDNQVFFQRSADDGQTWYNAEMHSARNWMMKD